MRAAPPPERLLWAVEQLEVDGADEVLEVGCGAGVAAGLICARLTRGHLLAIDRSPAMIAAARDRQRAQVAAGRAEFRMIPLARLREHARFDRALAVNVNLFWRRPDVELQVLRKVLKPGGMVCLVFQPPAAHQLGKIARACSTSLEAHGFVGVSTDEIALPSGDTLRVCGTHAA